MKRFKILALGTLCTSMTLLTVSACSLFPSETPNEGTYKITFSLNYDGANSQEVVYQYVNENETAVKPEDPQREDYVFLGWYRDSAGIEPYSFDSIVSEDIRLFAKWGLTTATVAFELGDGSTAATQSVNVGETVSEPSAPTREDYRFAGWYSDAKCTIPFDFNTAIESNTTLYAKWEQLVATVTFFEYDGAATTEKVDIGGKISAPALEPERGLYFYRLVCGFRLQNSF